MWIETAGIAAAAATAAIATASANAATSLGLTLQNIGDGAVTLAESGDATGFEQRMGRLVVGSQQQAVEFIFTGCCRRCRPASLARNDRPTALATRWHSPTFRPRFFRNDRKAMRSEASLAW